MPEPKAQPTKVDNPVLNKHQIWKCPETGIAYEFFMPTAAQVLRLRRSLKFEVGADNSIAIDLMEILPFVQDPNLISPVPDFNTMSAQALQNLLLAYYSFLNGGAVDSGSGAADAKGS